MSEIEKGEKSWWEEYWQNLAGGELCDHTKARYEAIREMIPSEVRTIIDVGCGSGLLTNYLICSHEVVGVDISERALTHVKAETRIGSVTDIPADDESFDLVLCTEVLEHLGYNGSFEKALRELVRVSSKFILVTVPSNDNLEYYKAKCDKCLTSFHHARHVRVFSKECMPDLLLGCFLHSYQETGERVKGLPICVKMAMVFTGYTNASYNGLICPLCHSRISPVRARKNPLSLLFVGLDILASKINKGLGIKGSHNIVALYQKSGK